MIERIAGMSRKQRLCWFVMITATVFVFCSIMTAAEWITVVTLNFAAFSAANVTDKKLGGNG